MQKAVAAVSPQEQNLLDKSRELFIRYGVKNLTMEEIAKQLGISKKTIYNFVTTKEELVLKVMENHLSDEQEKVRDIIAQSASAVDEMLQILHYHLDHLREFNTAAFFELQKYYPSAYGIFDKHRHDFVYGTLVRNLDKGKKQEVYRADFDTDIIARIYLSAIDIMLDQRVFPSRRYVFNTVYKEFVNYHLRGIVSAKGLKALEKNVLLKK